MFYLGFWFGGKLQGALAMNRVGESGGIFPWKILNFTLPEMQSSAIQRKLDERLKCYGQISRVQMQMKSNRLGSYTLHIRPGKHQMFCYPVSRLLL